MPKRTPQLLTGLVVLASVLGCQSRTDRVDSPVVLTIVGSTTIVTPGEESVRDAIGAAGAVIGSMTLTTIVKEPNAVTSSLESVEMESYTVTYTRKDSGTRVPPPLSESLFGSIAPNGTMTLTNFPYMRLAQLTSEPLADLGNSGIDAETGSATVLLNVNLQFFAHTLSGKRVTSEVKTFTVEMLP